MRCQSAGEIGCFDVSAGFSFPHLYRSPDFDGRPRFATMMQFPCPRSSCPYSPIFLINARERGHKILWLRTNTLRRKRCTNCPSPTSSIWIVSREITMPWLWLQIPKSERTYFAEPIATGAKGSGGPAVASFFASVSICPTPLPNGSSSEEGPLIGIDRKRPAHDQSYAIDPLLTRNWSASMLNPAGY